MGAAAIPIAIALSAGTTAYQISESEKAKKDAKKQQKKMEAQQADQERQLQEKKRRESMQKNEAYKIAVNRSRMTGTSKPTILTSPLGMPGSIGGAKTLLGA